MAAATAAVTAFGGSAIKAGSEFDSSMSQVAATMGTTVDEIGKLRDFAMEMGAKTAFSATQAADALNYMALAGYDADESMQALPNVLNLAAAGGIELAYASDMVTDAQSALGLSMEESADLVDKMAQTASKSNTSVAQLGEAILTVGGTAKTLAGGTTELSTALGILADNGVKGAEGGTALRNIILSLSAPTDTAAAAMKSLGLEVFDAEGNMRPLNETFGDLESALSTMTQGEQTQVLNQIFNKVDLKSVNALLANTGERFDELSGYIDNASGSAEKMAATQLDNFAGDVTLLKSAVEGVQIAFSDKLSPALRKGTQFLTELSGTVQQFIEDGGIEKIIQLFTDLSPAVAGVTAAVVAYKAAMAISSIVDAATKTVKAYQEANEGATAAQALLNTTIMKNPFALIVSLIATVVTALVTLYMTNEDFRNKVNAAWESVKETISNVVSAIATFFTETIPNAAEKAVDWFKAIPENMKEIGKNLIVGLWNGITEKVEWLKGKVTGVIDTVKGWFTGKDGFDEHSPSKWAEEVGKYVSEGLANGIEEEADEAQKAAEKMSSNIYSGLKKWADRQTKYLSLSYGEQADMWEAIQKQFAEGSEEYLEAEEKIFDLRVKQVEEYNEELDRIAKEEEKRQQEAQKEEEQRQKEAQKAWEDHLNKLQEQMEEYNKNVENRANQIQGWYSLFEAAPKSEKVSGNTLLKNLESQTKNIEKFYDKIDELSQRGGIGEALVNEIKEMGPSSMGELEALLSLSDEKLAKYGEEYQKKIDLSKKYAIQDVGPAPTGYETETVSFADSATGISSAALVNGISSATEGETTPVIPLTINLLTGDGDKFASWILPDLIRVANASGTPIASGQYA